MVSGKKKPERWHATHYDILAICPVAGSPLAAWKVEDDDGSETLIADPVVAWAQCKATTITYQRPHDAEPCSAGNERGRSESIEVHGLVCATDYASTGLWVPAEETNFYSYFPSREEFERELATYQARAREQAEATK